VKSFFSISCCSILSSISWHCSSNLFSLSFCCCSMSGAWLLLFLMIVWAISFYEVLNSANMTFINDFIFLISVSSSVLIDAYDATYIIYDLSRRRCICGTGPITILEPFLFFCGLGGSSGENSCEDCDGLLPSLIGLRIG
jgi:hypothetical protein